jgi:hypothetical protein
MMAQTEKPASPLLDKVVDRWKACGEWLADRPAQIVLTLLACFVVIAVLGLYLATTHNRTDIDTIQNALCNEPGVTYDHEREAQCQTLLTRLLKNPTPQQKARLRQIVREGSP